LGVSVSRAHEFNGSDDILQGDVGLNYHANDTLSFYLDTSVLARKSKNLVGFNNGNLTDVRVTVGVSKSF
jgi:predicted porin